MTDADILNTIVPNRPRTRLLWTAIVDVGDRKDLGASPLGQRFMVPILGGAFYAGPDIQGLNGKVLSGGADRQLLRADGVKELDALYEMQAGTGEVLTIRNSVTVDETRMPERYAMSVMSVTAPEGALDWLNRRVIIGTLQSARPTRQAVVVRAWMLDGSS